ncbi:la-related protein 7 [Anoplophora glabripennis]|nr:la-related protein 7 [Anoplophora glabripennis]
MGEGECEVVEVPKKGRHRKKQLYSSILQQMEFYFSDSNLSKDRFLSQLISENPHVDITVFLKFNKIRKLNCTLEDICKAVGKSNLIGLSEDREKIYRKQPLKVKQNVDDCTIYVENIKADANHEWLTQVFSEFGTVVYVSIPKYKQNKGNKGFAFVEFDNETEAMAALSYFESIGCKMPSETNPEDLRSIVTFDENVSTKDDLNIDNKIENIEDTQNCKKRKIDDDINIKKRQKTDLNLSRDDELEKETRIEENTETENKKKKKSKKDKKRNYIKDLGLQILSKKEWKKMRNRYLDLQRKNMKEFKQYLHKQNFTQNVTNNQDIDKNSEKEIPPKLEYVPGVIVKLVLPEPCSDVKKLKNDIKALSSDVKYVDIPPVGNEEIYVRFASSEGAKEFCDNEFPGERSILENEEEKSYWNKIKMDRNVKFSKSAKKQRGRDKLLKKAEKERAKHIRFEEAD